jgi:bisphosphoglycerate-dependent phosphoglycerate mutase
MPTGESLKMVKERITPYWKEVIIPQIKKQDKNKSTLFVAHEHVLRGMV